MADELDDLWVAARSRRIEPSEALMARVLADGLAEQPRPALVARRQRRGLFARLAEVFGGFGALAGMGGAALAGVALGFVQPAQVTEFADAVLGVQAASVELMPDAASLWAGE
ncbi:dihydroorotate dehydrogenase [Gemmobacter aquarius]|uniref:Dihydroorotate dehydrogenase n=1 Tax=Paragemmobacter aquarius TaxID=2169400 RepID=A0A2S0UJH8_9RHOB|nr:dihydroorotate dehydrogenase [Gemmobacter aquarius]AWB47945.1 dihydroorotate dehydrogenase [Gemmobacter aquarius]